MNTTPLFVARAASIASLWLVAGTLASCAEAPRSDSTQPPPANAAEPGVNPLRYDQNVWKQLLTDHHQITRRVVHRQEGDLGIVEATTESDDPEVAARILDHANSMQRRLKSGAQVRVWDPVFRDLFQNHEHVEITVTPTSRGVTIVESSRDPQTIALLRSHAAGLSEFVRFGHDAGVNQTPMIPAGAPLPPPEVAVGGVPHRFLLAQPDAAQLAMLKSQGVTKVVNFRKPTEPGTYDESSAARADELEYCALPYKESAELTDEVFRGVREQLRAAEGSKAVLALHCRTGNRVGPGWAAYLALDKNVQVENAIAGAKAVGMVDPLYESITRDVIRRELASRGGPDAAWAPVAGPLSPAQEAQRKRAEEARAAMFSRLFAALGEAMAAPGPDGQPVGPKGAISVCKEQAPRIAQAVSREQHVMIGRTSAKLRNAGNSPPSWAASLLADQPAEPRLAANPDGSLGVTLPIRVASACLACHGAPDQLEPGVRDALAAAYPKDQATGYREGDLRGWFWVEVPPAAK